MEKMYKNFEIVITPDYESLSRRAAEIIAAQITAKPDSVLGLATGSTPIGTYRNLVSMYKENKIDFAKVTTFNLDEYHPIKKSDRQSYIHFMKDNLFNHVNIPPENAHIQSGEAEDVHGECVQYERLIENAGGIDLQLLGLGHNGHLGFNEPDDIFPQSTHYVALDESTITANSRMFDSIDDVPRHAITMGIGTIMQAEQILILISGTGKAEIAEKIIFGDITPKVPGSVLQLHRSVTVILDADAAEAVAKHLR